MLKLDLNSLKSASEVSTELIDVALKKSDEDSFTAVSALCIAAARAGAMSGLSLEALQDTFAKQYESMLKCVDSLDIPSCEKPKS